MVSTYGYQELRSLRRALIVRVENGKRHNKSKGTELSQTAK